MIVGRIGENNLFTWKQGVDHDSNRPCDDSIWARRELNRRKRTRRCKAGCSLLIQSGRVVIQYGLGRN